jgi:hypothetical protein
MPDNSSADPAEVRRTFLFPGVAFVIAGAFSVSESGVVVLLWGVAFILVGSCAPAYLRLSDRAQLAVAAIILIALIAVGVALFVLCFQGIQNACEAHSADMASRPPEPQTLDERRRAT